MEARSAIHGAAISKSLVAVLAVSVTLGLGVTAGIVAKNLSGTAATQSHYVQGQGGPAFENPARRSGMQMLGDKPAASAIKAVGPDDRATTSTLAPNSFLGPDAQERNSQLAASAAPAASTKVARGNRFL